MYVCMYVWSYLLENARVMKYRSESMLRCYINLASNFLDIVLIRSLWGEDILIFINYIQLFLYAPETWFFNLLKQR